VYCGLPYCFFSGSCLAASLLDDAPELELGCEALDPELLGCALELELESLLLGAGLEPPEEPDFEVSELAEPDELLAGSLEPEGAALEPPEAEPDFEVSELDELDGLLAGSLDGVEEALPEGGVAALLDDEEPGVADEELGVVDDAPPEADPEVEPGALDGDDGVALLELDEPGAEEDLLALSRSHAARPKARATATARVESFMGPPWG
jgi:hypothetical protein